MTIIVRTRIKDIAKDYNIAADFPEALEKKVENIILEACLRAQNNSRKTIMAKDL